MPNEMSLRLVLAKVCPACAAYVTCVCARAHVHVHIVCVYCVRRVHVHMCVRVCTACALCACVACVCVCVQRAHVWCVCVYICAVCVCARTRTAVPESFWVWPAWQRPGAAAAPSSSRRGGGRVQACSGWLAGRGWRAPAPSPRDEALLAAPIHLTEDISVCSMLYIPPYKI